VVIARELQAQIGQRPEVLLWQDKEAIPYGSEWEQKIRDALGECSFLIPIVTPGFLQSRYCREELVLFRDKEAALGRHDLIFPLNYIDTKRVNRNRPEECFDPAIFDLLNARQGFSFTDLRFKDPNDEAVMSRIERFASAIQAALWREAASVAGLPMSGVQSPGTTALSASSPRGIAGEPGAPPAEPQSLSGPHSSAYVAPDWRQSAIEGRLRFQQFQYGPFHRLKSPTQTLAIAAEQERASVLLGRLPQWGRIPTVQAYTGPLPAGQEGIEFYTIARPSNTHPSEARWYLGDQDVWDVRRSSDTFAMIVVWIVELRYR
jgi:hypothetical protein